MEGWSRWNGKKGNMAKLYLDNRSNKQGKLIDVRWSVMSFQSYSHFHLRPGLVRSSNRFLSSIDNLLATFQFLRSSFHRSLYKPSKKTARLIFSFWIIFFKSSCIFSSVNRDFARRRSLARSDASYPYKAEFDLYSSLNFDSLVRNVF